MRRFAGVGALLFVAGFLLWSWAGDLEPPGPPGPTMKTLDEVEPRTPIHAADLPLVITASGSFYLAESITTAGAGIQIQTSDVTIDLMGFTLAGGTGSGIKTPFPVTNVTVRNGRVSGWADDGISMTTSDNSRLIDVFVENNGRHGLIVGDNSGAVHCTARGNTSVGIAVGEGSLIQGCTSMENALGLDSGEGIDDHRLGGT